MRATAVIVLALAAVGCGDDTIDADEIEAGIEQSLSHTGVRAPAPPPFRLVAAFTIGGVLLATITVVLVGAQI